MPTKPSLFLLLLTSISQCFAQTASNSTNSTILTIPQEYTYLLPDGFTGNANYTFVNGTKVPGNSSFNSLFSSAAKAPFFAYDEEFTDIFGENPEITLVEQRDNGDLFAYEAGVWVPETNEVWFTSSVDQARFRPNTNYILNLATNKISVLQTSRGPVLNADGGTYFQGKAYFATYPSNTTYRGGIVSVDVHTHVQETVVNSYFGVPFNGPNDLTWVTDPTSKKSYLFFTDTVYTSMPYANQSNAPIKQLPNAVYRFDPEENLLLPVITRNEVGPNGVRASPDQKSIYVTDTGGAVSRSAGPGRDSWLGAYIYKYTLDGDAFPTNRRVFGQTRDGISDGIHVDDKGRVWTAEGEGVVVRSPKGKVLGVVNSEYFLKSGLGVSIANFALAGDVLVVLAGDRLWTIKMAQEVIKPTSKVVD